MGFSFSFKLCMSSPDLIEKAFQQLLRALQSQNWIPKKNMLQTGNISKEKFDSWKSDMLAYYKDSRLDNEADSKTE